MGHQHALPGTPGGFAQHQKRGVKQIVPGACGGTCATAERVPTIGPSATIRMQTYLVAFIVPPSWLSSPSKLRLAGPQRGDLAGNLLPTQPKGVTLVACEVVALKRRVDKLPRILKLANLSPNQKQLCLSLGRRLELRARRRRDCHGGDFAEHRYERQREQYVLCARSGAPNASISPAFAYEGCIPRTRRHTTGSITRDKYAKHLPGSVGKQRCGLGTAVTSLGAVAIAYRRARWIRGSRCAGSSRRCIARPARIPAR